MSAILRSEIAAQAKFAEASTLLRNRDVVHALKSFDSAEELGFDPSQCASGRWNCWMLAGDFERAWHESDRIAAMGKDCCGFWNGQPWDGKRVMLRCLHGLGDTIQFIRYAPLLSQKCSSLFVQTHPQLVTLLEGVPGIDRVFTWGEAAGPVWDMQMEITELPRAFQTTISTIPNDVPYLEIPADRIRWASSLFQGRERLRVGLAWETGPWDPARSIPLEQFAPLFACERFDFYVLQKGADEQQCAGWDTLHPLECNCGDVRDTGALILNLDLIISADTMTAHLAGALGRPVWILLPAAADWRWMLERSDTPWYPTAQIIRQQESGGWSQVIEEVAENLLRRPFQRLPFLLG